MGYVINQYVKSLDGISVKISDRPNPVPYNYRITYRVAELCLIMEKSTSHGISLSKINILSDALSNQLSFKKIKDFVNSKDSFYKIKYDPIIIKILQYLIMDGLVIQQKNQKYKLTDKGKIFTKNIIEDEDLLIREKEILKQVGKALKESEIEQIQIRLEYQVD